MMIRRLSIVGPRLHVDEEPFHYQGLSFFNALYNPTFNSSRAERRRWLTGGYHNHHHDMFQRSYGRVFDHLRDHSTWEMTGFGNDDEHTKTERYRA